MKRFLKRLGMGILACFILYPGLNARAAEKTITAKFPPQFPPKHHLVRAANLFAKTVAEKYQGSIKIQVFPVGQIYKETEIVDAVRCLSVKVG